MFQLLARSKQQLLTAGEAEIISLDVGLRVEVLPALHVKECVFDVFAPARRNSSQITFHDEQPKNVCDARTTIR